MNWYEDPTNESPVFSDGEIHRVQAEMDRLRLELTLRHPLI